MGPAEGDTGATLGRLAFYATGRHACPYLPDREAVTLFADPAAPTDMALYSRLLRQGYRRSGPYIYRPACPACAACVPVRLPVAEFRPRRSQRHCQARNADLRTTVRPALFDPEHYALYRRYIAARHPDGGMETDSGSRYMEFLTAHWAETAFVEFRLGDRLVAVAVTDLVSDGLSAVYTFYDPDLGSRGLGTHAILWQIARARHEGLPHLYLGYWIAGSRKMAYKAAFRPLEGWLRDHWQRLPETAAAATTPAPPQAPRFC